MVNTRWSRLLLYSLSRDKANGMQPMHCLGFLDHAYALCAQDASLAATIITSRQFIHVAAAAYRGGVVQWLHARDTPLIAADNDEWQQWRSKAAAGAISCIWVKPSSLNLSATPLRTSPNGTEGMRRKTSLQLHGTGPVALIEAVRKFPNH